MKYVIKRVLIGVILFLIISFFKNSLVFAQSVYYLDMQKCNDLGGTAMCNSDIVRQPLTSDFVIPKNTIIKNVVADYTNINLSNGGSSNKYYKFSQYLESQFLPVDTNCPPNFTDLSSTRYKTAGYFNAKNYRPIACEGIDSQGNSVDCLSNIYTTGDNLLSYRNMVSEDSWSDITGSKGYFSSDSWYEYNGFYEPWTYYFVVEPNQSFQSISIKYGGFGSYIGDINSLYSGRDNSSWSPYYLDYPLINGCTYSSTETLHFVRSSWYDTLGFDFSNALNSVPLINDSIILPINSSDLQDEVSELEGNEELQTELALQDRLIGYDQQNINSNSDTTINTISNNLSSNLGNTPTLFYDFLALPINLLRENANQSLTREVGGAVYCNHYASQVITGDYNSVFGEVNLTIPFTNNNIKLDCFNVNVLSPYNKTFGSFYNNDSEKGLDVYFRPIWHVIFGGLLSYRLIIAYFRLIKDFYDPDDMSVEVLDL